VNQALGPDTKDALARELPQAAHCRRALLLALAYYGRDARGDAFVTHRNAVARLFWSLLEDRKGQAVAATATRALRGLPRFAIALPQALATQPPRPAHRCDRLAELRAAFLVFGVVATGARGYHLEFAPPDAARARRLSSLLRALGASPHASRRRGRDVFYFKDFQTIADLLARIGAHGAVLALEDVRALRETKNRIHRLVNTEAANLERAARAAAAQRQTIEYVARVHGLRRLSRPLREIASLRLRFPGESLAELGRRCDPAIGKTTASTRLAAIARLAARLRSPQQGQPGGGR
jgi:hypothetical protein